MSMKMEHLNVATGDFINGKPIVWGNNVMVEQTQWSENPIVFSHKSKFQPIKGNRKERKRQAFALGKLLGMKISASSPRLSKKRR